MIDVFDVLIKTFVVSALGIVIGYLAKDLIWVRYVGKLELIELPDFFCPNKCVIIDKYFNNCCFIRFKVKNRSKIKTFKNVRPIIRLVGEGYVDYIQGRPFYKIEVAGAVCWSDIGNPFERDIHPEEECLLDFCVILDNEVIRFPTERGWQAVRRFKELKIDKDGKSERYSDAIALKLFLTLKWKLEITLSSENGKPFRYKLDCEKLKEEIKKAIQ